MASFDGAIAIGDLVKTTLGPKGTDNILQSTERVQSVTDTNDGVTILTALHIDNPATLGESQRSAYPHIDYKITYVKVMFESV